MCFVKKYYLKKLMVKIPRCCGKTYMFRYYLCGYRYGFKWLLFPRKIKEKIINRMEIW